MNSYRQRESGIRLLACAAIALALPAWYFATRLASLRKAQAAPVIQGHPELARMFEHAARGNLMLFRGMMTGELLVAFALSVITCVFVRWRRAPLDPPALGARVASDAGLLLAFFLAPWLSGHLGFLELPTGNPLDLWIMGSLWQNAMPGITAIIASVLFVATGSWNRGSLRVA